MKTAIIIFLRHFLFPIHTLIQFKIPIYLQLMNLRKLDKWSKSVMTFLMYLNNIFSSFYGNYFYFPELNFFSNEILLFVRVALGNISL